MSIPQSLIIHQRRIGLTGGIASGKSTIANYIKKNNQIPILDADHYSKELIKPNSVVYKKILNHFGNQILDNSSAKDSINRSILKKLIFEDDQNREWIQKLLHPLIKANMIEKCNQYKDKKTVLLVIPLLFEAKFEDICTETWLVKCPEKIQIKRLIKRDKISEKEALKIINIQLNFEEKSKLSDVILDNSDHQNLWINKVKEIL